MKTLTVYSGLKIRSDLIVFLLIVPKTFELNANYIIDFRHYRRPNRQFGSLAIKSMSAVFV
jgi:hypothetical protein